MANKTIKNLSVIGYNAEFEYAGATGTFSASGEKKVTQINGFKEGVGNFDANRIGDAMHYNPHFSDPSKAADLVAVMTGAIEAIETELAAI